MPNIKLTPAAQYRVRYAAVKNPFAGIKGVSPIMKVRLMRGHNETAESRDLHQGEVITFVRTQTGRGSDPGIEALFRTADGFEGEFFPAGVWGGVSDQLLEAIA